MSSCRARCPRVVSPFVCWVRCVGVVCYKRIFSRRVLVFQCVSYPCLHVVFIAFVSLRHVVRLVRSRPCLCRVFVLYLVSCLVSCLVPFVSRVVPFVSCRCLCLVSMSCPLVVCPCRIFLADVCGMCLHSGLVWTIPFKACSPTIPTRSYCILLAFAALRFIGEWEWIFITIPI